MALQANFPGTSIEKPRQSLATRPPLILPATGQITTPLRAEYSAMTKRSLRSVFRRTIFPSGWPPAENAVDRQPRGGVIHFAERKPTCKNMGL